MKKFKVVVKTFAGLEPVLEMELKALGAESVVQERRAVSFSGDKAMLYKANFLLRTALKVLKPIARFRVDKKDDLCGSERKKPADDNGHTGYTAERKIIGEFKNINSNVHDQNSCGNDSIFF